jgi:hypothetical protein
MKFKKKLGPVYFFSGKILPFLTKKLEFFLGNCVLQVENSTNFAVFFRKFPNFQYQKKEKKKLGLIDN